MYERLWGAETQSELWVNGSGQVEAIEYARDPWPDIIVSDVDVRTGAKGPALLGDLRATPKLEHVPVVLVAAVQPDARIIELVDRVLLKPIDPATLLAEVGEVLEYSKHGRAVRRFDVLSRRCSPGHNESWTDRGGEGGIGLPNV